MFTRHLPWYRMSASSNGVTYEGVDKVRYIQGVHKKYTVHKVKNWRKSGLLAGWGNVLECVHLSRAHALLHHQVRLAYFPFFVRYEYRAFWPADQCCGSEDKYTFGFLDPDSDLGPESDADPDLDPDPDSDPDLRIQIRIRIKFRIRIKIRVRIEIRIRIQI